jgi:hypothetical protein
VILPGALMTNPARTNAYPLRVGIFSTHSFQFVLLSAHLSLAPASLIALVIDLNAARTSR